MRWPDLQVAVRSRGAVALLFGLVVGGGVSCSATDGGGMSALPDAAASDGPFVPEAAQGDVGGEDVPAETHAGLDATTSGWDSANAGGPSLSVQLRFEPEDGATAVGSDVLRITAFGGGRTVDEPMITALTGAVALETWPEKVAVAARIAAGVDSTQNPQLVVTPEAPLQGRWYVLRVKSLPEHFTFWPPLEDGTLGTRFRPDSHPIVRRLEFCEKAGAGMKLVLLFSEAVATDASSAAHVSVDIDGAPTTCSLYWPTPGGLYFTCDRLAPTSVVKVAVGAGLKTPAGVEMAPGAWTVDVSKLLQGSCRSFHTPL